MKNETKVLTKIISLYKFFGKQIEVSPYEEGTERNLLAFKTLICFLFLLFCLPK